MHRTQTSGFTLIELMVTIAIVAILAALAFPSFESSIRSNRVATMTNEMLASLALARTEAIRSTHVSGVCASADGKTCGADWNQGWIVWTDSNVSGGFNAGDEIVRYTQAHANMSVAATGAVAGVGGVQFDTRGRLGSAGVNPSLVLQPSQCPVGDKLVRQMSLGVVGQVKTATKACA